MTPKMFLQMSRVYLFGMSEFTVVFSVKSLLGSDAEKEDTLYYVTFWFNAIGWSALQSPVVLVGTHKDEVINACDAQKSNIELALTNADMQRAHKIIGDHIRSLEVYNSGNLELHTPKQCKSQPSS